MVTHTTLQVENLKCGGCENSVRRILKAIQGLSNVEVNSENGVIEFHQEDNPRITESAIHFLNKAGYPPMGESDLKARAISYVSCLRGKLN